MTGFTTIFAMTAMFARITLAIVVWILLSIFYGFAAATRRVVQFTRYVNALTSPYYRLNILQRPSAYAVITGATDGIGYAFAHFLYLRGWNLLLVGRSNMKLVHRRDALHKAYRAIHPKATEAQLPDIQTWIIDFSDASVLDYSALHTYLLTKDIALLINNVGMNTESAQHFQDMSPHVMEDMLAVNQYAAMRMTHSVLQQRRALDPETLDRQPCLILNISSASSLLPACPSMSVYAATKAFMNTWSDALRAEVCCLDTAGDIDPLDPIPHHRGERDFMHYATHQCADAVTRIETLTPFFITTKLSGVQQTTWSTPDAATYVASALRYINVFDSWTGYWPHSILRFALTRLVPTPKLIPYIDQMLHTIKPTAEAVLREILDDDDGDVVVAASSEQSQQQQTLLS